LYEGSIAFLAKVTVRCESSHDSAQRRASSAGRLCEVLQCGFIANCVDQLESRGEINGTREPMTGNDVENCGLRSELGLHGNVVRYQCAAF
jgi:hypothetical protein